MERENIFVRKIGIVEAEVNRELGVAKDSDCKYYFLTETPIPGSKRWVPEEYFWITHKTPENGGIEVRYGVKHDDPLRGMIHKIKIIDGETFQFQISRVDGYISLFKVANEKKFIPYAPEGMKSIRNTNMRKGPKMNRKYRATKFHGDETPIHIYARKTAKV